jgi:site-specific recombinase XerD
MEGEEWPMPFEHGAWNYPARRALLAQVVPVYQTASRARKHLILNAFVKATSYARPTAIRLLNHPPSDAQVLRRSRLPIYGPEVQQALFLAWKASHYVCAKRLLPSLPTLMELLEQYGHLHVTEEHCRQILAMSVSTAERLLRTQHKPGLHGLSTTTPGPLRKDQISVRTFSPWQDDRPGFVEMDLVAHCGSRVDGSFLYTLTLTDLATGWTECLPLLYKSADAVLAALAQARVLFPFPLLGIDTDCGSEFLNEGVIAYCEQHQLTFTRGRPGFKNDQAHVEQKNGAVVREAVGCVRLEGIQAYHQLREVYRALRLVVNCFQPSLKLQAKVSEGDQVRRIYDVAQTPLRRLLASGVLSEAQQATLNGQVQQIDPLALSVHLDALRYALWCGAHLPTAIAADQPLVRFTQAACLPGFQLVPEAEEIQTSSQEVSSNHEEILNWPRTTHDPFAGFWEEILALVQAHPEWTGTQIVQGIRHQVSSHLASSPMRTLIHRLTHIRASLRTTWEEPWPTELIQGGTPETLPDRAPVSNQAVPASDQHPARIPMVRDPQSGAGTLDAPGSATEKPPASGQITGRTPESRPLAPPTIAQAIAAYLQEMREMGREPKTVQWHQTSLSALQQYLWDQFRRIEVRQLSREALQRWLTDLHTVRSSLTGARLSVNTIAAYARSGRAFCNWLVRQGSLPATPFPLGEVPKAQHCLPQPVEAKVFVSLLRACQVPDENAGHQDVGMTVRNRAILWLLLDTGLSVSELCSLHLADVDSTKGTVTVRGKGGRTRTLPFSAKGQRAVSIYLEQARLTPAWSPATPEAQETLLLTELRHPLTKNSLTLLFMRLSQRAGFTTKPISPSMLRDTYGIRFLQAGGELSVLQEQLGLADPASIRRYRRFCEEQRREVQGAQACPEEVRSPRSSRRRKSKRQKTRKRGRGHQHSP